MGHPKAELAEVADRRRRLVRLRREGVPYDDPRITALGYNSSRAASKDLVRALEQSRDDQAAEVSIYRQQENERLDELLKAAWPRATEPHPVLNKDGDVVAHEIDFKAVDTVLKLMDRRAKLNGLDMPVKAELSGPDGGSIPLAGTLNELVDLIDTAGETTDDEETATEEADDSRD